MEEVLDSPDAWDGRHNSTDSVDLFGRIQLTAERYDASHDIDIDPALWHPRCAQGFALHLVFELGIAEGCCNLNSRPLAGEALNSSGCV
jgi:hypothetical protein